MRSEREIELEVVLGELVAVADGLFKAVENEFIMGGDPRPTYDEQVIAKAKALLSCVIDEQGVSQWFVVEPWSGREPGKHEMIVQLRQALGMYAGASPTTPQQAWEEALDAVRSLKQQFIRGAAPRECSDA